MRVTLLNLGATIQSIQVPTAEGAVDAILGFANPDDYWADSAYLGSTVGRFANRIHGARFSLDGQVCRLDANETSTGHCLHGGSSGFHKQFWTLEPAVDGASAVCRYLSPDGAGGFPGNLEVSVNYQLARDDRLIETRSSASPTTRTLISIGTNARLIRIKSASMPPALRPLTQAGYRPGSCATSVVPASICASRLQLATVQTACSLTTTLCCRKAPAGYGGRRNFTLQIAAYASVFTQPNQVSSCTPATI